MGEIFWERLMRNNNFFFSVSFFGPSLHIMGLNAKINMKVNDKDVLIVNWYLTICSQWKFIAAF